MKRNRLNSFIRHYTISLWRYLVNEWKLTHAHEITLVYTMAKVGSMSIYLSLKEHTDHPVFHIHDLDATKYQQHLASLRLRRLYPDSRPNTASILRTVKNGKRINVVTLVREPIARNVSAFFEVLEYHTYKEKEATEFSKLKKIYFDKLLHALPLKWFDEELKHKLNIDVYSKTFDVNRKSSRISCGAVNLLVLRTDTPDEVKIMELNKLCSANINHISQVNVAGQKHYSKMYESFLRQIDFDVEYIQKMYQSKYMRHFYSPREIKKFATRWQKKN